MSQFDNRVAALGAALNSAYKDADPNTGEGLQGEWPPQGDHDCFISAMTVKPAEFKEKSGMKTPCLDVQFEYEWIRTEKDPGFVPGEAPLVFRGEVFHLVDPARIADTGAQTRARISIERFKGHSSKILNKTKEQCVDTMQDIAAMDALIRGSTKVAVRLRAQYRDGKADPTKPNASAPVYKTDFILDNITG